MGQSSEKQKCKINVVFVITTDKDKLTCLARASALASHPDIVHPGKAVVVIGTVVHTTDRGKDLRAAN